MGGERCGGQDPGALGPPDLDHAIQAASRALADAEDDVWSPDDAARIAVEAAWPRSALAELAVLRHSSAQMRDLTREQDKALQAMRDRLAGFAVYAAELRELIADAVGYVETEAGWGDTTAMRMRAALAADPPARGRATLEEVGRLRELEETARNALSCLRAGNAATATSLLTHALGGRPPRQEVGGGG